MTTTERTPAELASALDELERRRGLGVDATLAEAVQAQEQAAALEEPVLERRAVLVQSDMLGRKGDLAASAQRVWSVHQWAMAHENRPLLARSHRLLTRTFHNLGDDSASLEHAVLAMEAADDDTAPVLRTSLLSNLADALGNNGSYQAAYERYAEAERLLVALDAPEDLINVLNNHAFTRFEAGDLATAQRLAGRMLEVSESRGLALNPGMLDTLAAVRLAAGDYAAAEQSALDAVEFIKSGRYHQVELLAQHLVTLARARRLRGDLESAERAVQEALSRCEDSDLRGFRVRALAEAAAVAASTGQWQRAYELHVAFHDEGEVLTSAQREAAARTRQAIFETDEARAAAERFREQALRDSLTGLRNRRYFDEELESMLQGAAPEQLVLALVDLDHFKHVNDTYSHEVGDSVLRATAELLEACLRERSPGDGCFAARIGGEEFGIVLPGVALDDATSFAELLRVRMRSHDWSPLLHDDVQTISVGLAVGAVGQGAASILREADANLYAAKASGRDQVAWTPADDAADRRLYR
ncbi:diguanylate cyclase (GGDEF)-like protein [Motilibacter peucedani]|uniref:Diguanylate cyclase (GGDEF)-like protein n=1 Tax=Motilibacter peucedani TaxID=598650 RepID=A0A420XRZ9_9ACTN|nr:GGDEF domain-containing protein [Motilibacter peucedani]RKS77676.1 diguanylate cyclase (GGDEF)-like protein [Motilibacter peucedani]